MKPSIAWRNPNTYIVIAIDAALLYLSFWLAHWLRFEQLTDPHFRFFGQVVYPVIALKLLVFAFFGLESGMWRYTSVVDLVNLIKASAVSFIIIISGILYLYYPNLSGSFSRSVFIIDTINTIFLIGLFRLSIRLYYSRTERDGVKVLTPGSASRGIPALIYGAGNRAELLLRSMTSEPDARYNVLGLLDDNLRFNGSSIHGYRIFGPLSNLERLTNTFDVKELLVAMQVSGERMEEINSICRALNITCRVTPTYLDSAGAMIRASSLRNIQVEDLLAREPVSIDYSRIGSALAGKRVMITGAGGSIGSQLALRIAEFKPARMILVDKCENYLHQLEVETQSRIGEISAGYYCVDITNHGRIKRIFELEKPEYLFHAAAHKHVPMMERNKGEAVRNNIGGMKTVAGLAEEYGVERFILISTDKAVDPANIMGATKRICELYMRRLARKSAKTQYLAVRFGNVLGSNGSVEPMFKEQIESRGPVTVTHPDVERYFMTIPEAVLLILQSATFAGQGEIYLLDMGKPVKILELAERMIRMAGFEPGKDINIVFTGLRPGEKLQEELVAGDERMEQTAHPKIYSVQNRIEQTDELEKIVDIAIENCFDNPDVCVDQITSWINRVNATRVSASHVSASRVKISNSAPQ